MRNLMSDSFSDICSTTVSDLNKLSTVKPCWHYLVGMRQEDADRSLESKVHRYP